MNKTTSSKKAPKIYHVHLEKMNTNVLPAGKYFIGDPAYFLHDSIAGQEFEPGHYALPDGRGFILHDVRANAFIGTDKQSYSVESGRFGIISVELGDYDKYTGDGTFHEFKKPVTFSYDKDMFVLGADSEMLFEVYEQAFSEDEGYDSCG